MAIPSCGDKITPVADDGDKNRNKHPADDAEAERSEGGDPVEETCRELENNLKKVVDNSAAM